MTAIKAIVQGGRLELKVPPDWPDGTEVEIHPLTANGSAGDDSPMTPDEIARVLEAMEKVEPFALTGAEEEAIEADRQGRREREKADFDENADKLQRHWE